MKYIFFLGRIPALSCAEIQALMEKLEIEYAIDLILPKMLILDIKSRVNFENIFPQMGGTIKIAEVLDEYENYGEAFGRIVSAVEKLNKKRTGKKIVGYSIYFTPNADKNKVFGILKETRKKFINIKKSFAGLSSMRLVFPEKNNELASASIVQNKILKKGAEFDFVFDGKKIILARTIAVQNITDYSLRDYGRPRRDARIGITPPKLAQIMLNLAQIKKGQTVFDPFCGVGSILQETLLSGYKAIGCDINEKQIYNCKINLDWLLKRFDVEYPDYKIFQSDSTKPFASIEPNSVDAIVTESILGPVYKRIPQKIEIAENYKNLEEIYMKFFHSAKPLLKEKSKLVITLPAYKISSKEYIFAPFVDKLIKIGYSIICPLDKAFMAKDIKTTGRNSIVYDRPDQIVAREIIIFERE